LVFCWRWFSTFTPNRGKEVLLNLQDYLEKLKPNVIVRGPLFPEPVQVITTIPIMKNEE
jgi:hypothetical protein